jgi:hypothetical protein
MMMRLKVLSTPTCAGYFVVNLPSVDLHPELACSKYTLSEYHHDSKALAGQLSIILDRGFAQFVISMSQKPLQETRDRT